MRYGLRRELSFSASWILASAERGRPLFSTPTAAGMSAPAMACSSSSSAGPERRRALISPGSRSAFRRASTGATSSHPSQPCSRVASSRQVESRKDNVDRRPNWPDDLAEIVYVDHFGNAMTGLRATMLPEGARLAAAGQVLERANTFSDLPSGGAFWYENANGLAEIAVNQGRADRALSLTIGSPVTILS